MSCFVSHTTIDCTDAYALSTWWRQVLDYTDLPDDPNEPGHEECVILDPATGHRLLFIQVPEPKSGKNRLHLDLRPREGTRDEEVERLLALGARSHADLRGKYGPGTGWVVLQDPAGNEFCVLRAEGEVAGADAD